MSEHSGKPGKPDKPDKPDIFLFKGEVLLCEDNSMNQDIVRERLERLGVKTITANNGKEGLEKAEYRIKNGIKPFDLIFMDIFMPVMGGLEAADRIAKLNTGTPIVAMTANNAQEEREQYAAHGMSDCLNKPFTSQELLSCLAKYMKPADSKTEYDSIMEDEKKIKNKLIHNFVKNNKNFYNEITKTIDDGDIKTAHRLAHTLKSTAGFFGKTRLQNAAKNVEDLLKNEENMTNPAVMNVLNTELNAVFEEFESLATEDSERKNNQICEHGDAPELFRELEILLDGGDVECLNLTGRLRAIQGTDEPLVQTLIQQIEDFEFDTAKETLARLTNGG